MEDMRNEIISRIRSCLISTKGMVTVRQLQSDYYTLLGERIPYQKLGYGSLESFLQTVPTIITSRSPQGELLVDAKVSEKSAHISSMVRKQKAVATRKKVKLVRPPLRTFPQQFRTPPRQSWRPKGVVKKGARTATANHHYQFVNVPTVASKVVVPPTSLFYNNQAQALPVKKQSPPKKVAPPPKKESPPTKKMSPPREAASNVTTNDVCKKSTMNRITKRMAELNTENDSGHSSPTEHISEFASGKEFVKTGDPIIDLRNFVAYRKLADVKVSFTETKLKRKRKVQYHCKITVGKHKYSSYPEDFFDAASAEKHASQRALDDLILKYAKRQSLLLSSGEDILERIPPMLEKHKGAVWMWQIEDDYIDKYKEQLPSDWLQIIDSSPFISIEKCLGACMLRHCRLDGVRHIGEEKQNNHLNLGDVSVPCNTVNFDEENGLYALVVAATSVCEIWCQQCGTPEYEKYVKMSELMEAYYTTTTPLLRPLSIRPKGFYAVNHEGCWYRARALDSTESNSLTTPMFLIDYGEEIEALRTETYVLERLFATEQAQAFVCKLEGLDDLHEISLDSENVTNLVGKEMLLELVTDEERSEDDVILPVVMYDVSDSHNVNEELIKLFALELANPTLGKKTITQVYICNIETNGDLYVQIRSFGYQYFQDLLEEVTSILSNTNPPSFTPPTKDSPPNNMYLVKDKLSQKWRRATIIDWAPSGGLAQIYFVDEGTTQVVNVSNEMILPLEGIDEFLGKIPAQAVRVRMTLEKFPVDFVERARRLLPPDQPVLLKFDSYDKDGLALVELFKRTGEGVLVFVNKSIAVEAELQNFDSNNVSGNENKKKRLLNLVREGLKTSVQKKQNIPKVGEYFNVHISFSVNPWNFFIQPLDSLKQLKELMAEMQEFYKDLQFSPLPVEEIIPGKIYASKHEDGMWYRTTVLKVIHSGSISVFYCDFGFYTNITSVQLVSLSPKYLSLPLQGLKAKLAGIKPVKNKWTMEDCELFNKMVMKKRFVSILVSVEKDELHKNDLVLQLVLIDTSKQKDLNLKDVLIEKGVAIGV